MNKFLDLLDSIREGAPTPLGFGASRAQKLPGIALIGMVSNDHKKIVTSAAKSSVDAVIIEGIDKPTELKKIIKPLAKIPWGAKILGLGEGQAQALQDEGSDLVAFNVEGTVASNLVCDQIARILCVETGMAEEDLRALASLPVDVFLIPMKQVSNPWSIQDLASLSVISRRVDKYILIEVSESPGSKDLEALRDIGVNGIVVDMGLSGSDGYSDLKKQLMDMPRSKHSKRDRSRAILPGSAFSPAPEPQEEEDDDHDHEE
tara:strand:- start:34 stop:816 length:783 start_codon:yes stop_codon:yes gene_type:complete